VDQGAGDSKVESPQKAKEKLNMSNQNYKVLDTFDFFDQGQQSRVFCANINVKTTTTQHDQSSLLILRRIFEQTGPVHQINLNKNQTSTTATVHYASLESAQRAIKELHNTYFNQRPLKIRKDARKNFTLRSKRLWLGHATALANSLFGHMGWSTNVVALKTADDGTVSCTVALHIYQTEDIVVETNSPNQTLIVQVECSETPSADEQRNVSLPKIVMEKAKLLAFEKVRCSRVKYGENSKVKLIVFADEKKDDENEYAMEIANASTATEYVEYE